MNSGQRGSQTKAKTKSKRQLKRQRRSRGPQSADRFRCSARTLAHYQLPPNCYTRQKTQGFKRLSQYILDSKIIIRRDKAHKFEKGRPHLWGTDSSNDPIPTDSLTRVPGYHLVHLSYFESMRRQNPKVSDILGVRAR